MGEGSERVGGKVDGVWRIERERMVREVRWGGEGVGRMGGGVNGGGGGGVENGRPVMRESWCYDEITYIK